jgi:hypothetical protein
LESGLKHQTSYTTTSSQNLLQGILKDNSRFKASKRDNNNNNNNKKTTVTTRSAVSEFFSSSNLDCNLKHQQSIFPKTKQNECGVHFKYHLNHQFRNPSQTNHEWEHQ